MDLNTMTDDELIAMAQNGDAAALEAILTRYKPLVHKKSQPYYLAGGDDDDIVQEGLIGLYKAVMDFDKSRFPLFHVFAGVCVERRIISAVKKASRQKHNPLNSYVSLSDGDIDGKYGNSLDTILNGGEELDPEHIFIEQEKLSGIETIIAETLSPFEREVLMLHINGVSYKETAQRLGRDAKAVDNAIQRIKKKLSELV